MILQPHTIKPAKGARHAKKKRGRGNASGHGNYSGRGGKGQTARSGGSAGLKLLGFKFQMQSTPKLRGFKSLAVKPAEVLLGDLEKNFSANETVTLKSLAEKGIISKNALAAKILNTGALTKKLTIEGLRLTKAAVEQVRAAGGEVK
ncbi:50S ribosomal protein L15 [Patescibacteria group bacterium]|nr:MAG: 50S ribosomal protein L15 [Patescibacteria group bacterium]